MCCPRHRGLRLRRPSRSRWQPAEQRDRQPGTPTAPASGQIPWSGQWEGRRASSVIRTANYTGKHHGTRERSAGSGWGFHRGCRRDCLRIHHKLITLYTAFMPVTWPRGRFGHYGRPKRRGPARWLVLLMLAVLVAGGGWFGWQQLSSTPTKAVSGMRTPKPQTPAPEPKDLHPNRIRLIAAGDFLPHDAVNRAAQKPDGSYDYLPLMNNFVPIFDVADIRFCNLSAVTGGAQFGISGYPRFNGPTEFSRDMGRLGCNLVNTGTNHSFDRNQDAINVTLDTWAKVPNMLA